MVKNCTLSVRNTSGINGSECSPGLQKEHGHFSLAFQVCGSLALVVMMATAVFGNVVVCYIVYQKPAMRSAINLLLSNLALVDVLIAVTCMTFALVTLLANKWVFGEVFCNINAFVFSFLLSESTYILLAISCDRYLIIVRRKETLTPHKAKLVILWTWVLSIIPSIPPTIGWGKYTYQPGSLQCTLDDNSLSYSVVFHLLTIVVPMLSMAYVYCRILHTVHKNSTKVINHPPVATAETRVHKRGRLNIAYGFKTRAFLTILILFIVYFCCFLPYLITRLDAILGRHLSLSPQVEVILILVCYFNSMINPLLYYLRIRKFREACHDIMPGCCCFFPVCTPKRPLRRICPHVLYEVDETRQNSMSVSFHSMGAFDIFKQEST